MTMIHRSKSFKKGSGVAKIRRQDHATSVAASDAISGRVTELMRAAYKAIKKAGTLGLTDSEVTAALMREGYPQAPDSTYRKRRTELTQLGHVKWNGARRRNANGSMEKVWVVSGTPLSED